MPSSGVNSFSKLQADTIPITTDTSSVSSKSSKKEPNSKNEVIGKYHNLSEETDEVENSQPTKPQDVQLRFVRDNRSTWSLNSSTVSSAQPKVPWYKHPKVREHWKVVVASFVLFFIGICLCIVGIILEALETELGGIFMLFVIGVICFIPGVYHIIAVYYAVKGKRGFSFYNLPLFN